MTYVRAVKRNLIKGLATYNILQNPAYKEAFGITWKFAIDHHDVRSIRKHKVMLFIDKPLDLPSLIILVCIVACTTFRV